MDLFSLLHPSAPTEVTDANGDIWKPAPSPCRNGEPVYYNTTGPDGYALTPTEIEQEIGRR
jgi:hypothetical protein